MSDYYIGHMLRVADLTETLDSPEAVQCRTELLTIEETRAELEHIGDKLTRLHRRFDAMQNMLDSSQDRAEDAQEHFSFIPEDVQDRIKYRRFIAIEIQAETEYILDEIKQLHIRLDTIKQSLCLDHDDSQGDSQGNSQEGEQEHLSERPESVLDMSCLGKLEHIRDGLLYLPNFITETEEAMMQERVNIGEWYNRSGRMMQSYGFNYKKGEYDAPLHETTPIPVEFRSIIERINSLTKRDFNQMTVNRYEPGQGIDAHYDHLTRFGDTIVGITLGSGCTLTFQHMKDRVDVYLEPRSLYVMQGDMRYVWKHKISKLFSDEVDGEVIKRGTRTSLTFRICT